MVVIGDSISQGFKNGGIYRTDINFPALLCQCFEPVPNFTQPNFTAQAGIPINLEMLVRGMSDQFGDSQAQAALDRPYRALSQPVGLGLCDE